ncbi:MAG: Gldg family protein [Candidatus Poribacteria bacterium]|nr:Gldg family protein [Candidatus Poribacteria bacterium]
MATRTLKYGSNTLVFILVVLAILAAISFLSSRRFVRADFSDDKRYTISSSTKNVLKRLDDVVTINAYFSREPARVAQIRRDVRDVLDEYRAISNKLQIDFIDPGDDEAEKNKLRFMGIPEVQMNVIEKDKAQVANVYMGLAVIYEDKKEILPVVQNTFTLEYDLTSAILKVTRTEVKTIGFLSGHDELDIDDERGLGGLKQELSKQFNVKKVSIDAGREIEKDVATLVVAGPKQEITESEKYEIDQFIMRGGRAIFLVDTIHIPQGTLQATPLTTGLNDLLEHYGVKHGNNLVLDNASPGQLTYTQGYFTVRSDYPYFVKVLNQYRNLSGEISRGLSDESIVTSQLESLTLNWASSLELLQKEDNAIETIALAKTTDRSWTVQSPYDIAPNAQLQPPSSVRKSHTVAASLSGVFKSFYTDKDIPSNETTSSDEPEGEVQVESETSGDRTTITESQPTQIVVVGNSSFLQFGGRDELTFFYNTIDWLTLGEDLIHIRSHGVTDRPLKEVSEGQKLFLKYANIAGVPIVVVVFGLIRYLLRRRAKRLVETYGTL